MLPLGRALLSFRSITSTGTFRKTSQEQLHFWRGSSASLETWFNPKSIFSPNFLQRLLNFDNLRQRSFMKCPRLESAYDENENIHTGKPVNYWMGVGGFLLAVFLLKKEGDFLQKGHCAEMNSLAFDADSSDHANVDQSPERSDRTEYEPSKSKYRTEYEPSQSMYRRLQSVNLLRNNQSVKDPIIELGLELDPEMSRKYGKLLYQIPMEKGTKISCSFRAELVKGQLVWNSFESVYDSDVRAIADFYHNLKDPRHIHINTGIYGTSEGRVFSDIGSLDFVRSDLNIFDRNPRVSLHIVSSVSPPLTPRDLPDVDILNAWCHSSNYKQDPARSIKVDDVLSDEETEVSFKEIMEHFPIRVGYPNKKISTAFHYVEIDNLKEDICNILEKSSFCSVIGIGGSGKSTVVSAIESAVRKIISLQEGAIDLDSSLISEHVRKIGEECLDTIFISLMTEYDRIDFLKHIRKIVGDEVSDDFLIKVYFQQLATLAHMLGKTFLVVIDGVDSQQDLAILRTVSKLSSKFKRLNNRTPFKLLVTGRRDLSQFIREQALDPSDVVIEIENYLKSEKISWDLLSAIFLKELTRHSLQIEGRQFLETNRSTIQKIIDKVNHHPGFICLFSQGLSEAFIHKESESFLDAMSKDVSGLFQENGLLTILQSSLDMIDREANGVPKRIYQAISFLSDGYLSKPFLKILMREYFCLSEIESLKILAKFNRQGLINYSHDERLISMPIFYNRILRDSLLEEYLAEKDFLDSLVDFVLQKIENDVCFIEDDHVSENMEILMNLYNVTQLLPKAESLYSKVLEVTANYASRKLNVLKYEDVIGKYNHFLSEIQNRSGYSLDVVLSRFMLKNDMNQLVINLIQNLKNEERNSDDASGKISKLLRSLNNFYVLSRVNDKTDSTVIHVLFRSCQDKRIDKDTRKIISSNLIQKNVNDLCVFPEITFHHVSFVQRERAEFWKIDNPVSDGNKIANLSRKGIIEGIKLLIPFLMEGKQVEEIDFSYNSLAQCDVLDLIPLCDLLEYFGSLKRLRLNNNILHKMSDAAFYNLLKALKINSTIEVSSLNNNSLNDAQIEAFCESFKEHPTIREIHLHSNCFSNKGLDSILRLIKSNKNIRVITTAYAHEFLRRHRGTVEFRRDQSNNIIEIDSSGNRKVIDS